MCGAFIIFESMQLNLFEEASEPEFSFIEELFQAYYDCRKNKRNTLNALAFEKHFEHNLFQLHDQVITGAYSPGRSIAFIVNYPVKREVFAADFRDRVMHHWLINKINPLFETIFIEDSYACRVGKGTHYGISRINEFIKACSNNYTQDCYILKLDIQGFFMHINRNILFERVQIFLKKMYLKADKDLLIEICKRIIFNDPIKDCFIKGSRKNWEELPPSKSLFHSAENCGLPIGNLTSQVFANFYMNYFDHFIKDTQQLKYYGRYVDDFIIVHSDKEYLKSIISQITSFLISDLHLTLHPKKVYLQHFSKGVKFLGAVIKPNRIYIANRTKGNFVNAIEKQNCIVRQHKPSKNELAYFLSSMNSYLGMMVHYQTFNLRKKIVKSTISAYWLNHFYISGGYAKFVAKSRKVKKSQQKSFTQKGSF